jgi:hypothetical protein
MIKKTLLLALFIACITLVCAQNDQDGFDALRVSQTQLRGTARYVSMGGAFTALGKDGSSISLNPAGLGMYKESETTVTAGMDNNTVKSSWIRTSNNQCNTFFNVDHFSLVLAVPYNDRFSSAFGFTYDRLKSFNRSGTISSQSQSSSLTDFIAYRASNGTTDAQNNTTGFTESALKTTDNYHPFTKDLPWLSVLAYNAYLINPVIDQTTGKTSWKSLLYNNETVSPSYTFKESGNIDQFGVSYGANLDRILFLGLSVGFQSINYTKVSDYSEAFAEGGHMQLHNKTSSTGNGFDVKLGIIICPTKYLRLGFSYHTPVFYSITDTYTASLEYGVNYNGTLRHDTIVTPDASCTYKIQTPGTYTFGIALLLLKKGIVSIDYQYQDYTTMKIKDTDGFSSSYDYANENIKKELKGVSTFRIGGEFFPWKAIAFRLGYNYVSPATKKDAYRWWKNNSERTDSEYLLDVNTQNFTAGLGWHNEQWNIDAAFVSNRQKQRFYVYADSNLTPASLTTINNRVLLTLGYKF